MISIWLFDITLRSTLRWALRSTASPCPIGSKQGGAHRTLTLSGVVRGQLWVVARGFLNVLFILTGGSETQTGRPTGQANPIAVTTGQRPTVSLSRTGGNGATGGRS